MSFHKIKISEDFKILIQSMLCIEPSKRAKISEIKESAWFKGAIPDVDSLKAYLIKRKQDIEHQDENYNEEEKLISVNGPQSRLQTRRVRDLPQAV